MAYYPVGTMVLWDGSTFLFLNPTSGVVLGSIADPNDDDGGSGLFQLDNGKIVTAGQAGHVHVYDSQLAGTLASVSFGGSNIGCGDVQGDTIAYGRNTTAKKYDDALSVLDTKTVSAGIKILGVSPDLATIYTSPNNDTVTKTPFSGSSSTFDTQLETVALDPGTILTLADAAIVVAWESGGFATIRCYETGGSVRTATAISPSNYSFVVAQWRNAASDGIYVALKCTSPSTVKFYSVDTTAGTSSHLFDKLPGTDDPTFGYNGISGMILQQAIGTPVVKVIPPLSPTPSGPQTPCTPQAQVSGGGIDNTGCNVGGTGRDPDAFTYPGYGVAPTHTDPTTGETLNGKRQLDLWCTIYHVDYPSGTVVPYSFSLVDLADAPSYYNGRKEAGLLTVGNIEHGLSNETNGLETASIDLNFQDALLRHFRTLFDTQNLEGDEVELYIASPTARAAAATPHVIMRGIIQTPTTGAPMGVTITAVDPLFSFYGPFGQFPSWPFWKIGDIFGDAPADVKSRALPYLYGPKHDIGATDPVTDTLAEKGLTPWHWVGRATITGTDANAALPTSEDSGSGSVDSVGILGSNGSGWTSDGTVDNDPYHYVARVIDNVMGPLVGGKASTPSTEGTVYGFRTVWNDSGSAPDYYIVFQVPADITSWDPFSDPAPPGSNIRYQIVSPTPTNPFSDWQFINFWNTPDDGKLWGDTTGLEDWDVYLILGHASYAGGAVFGSDLGGGNPSNRHDRTKLDLGAVGGSQILYPWNEDGTVSDVWTAAIGADTFVDQVGSDGNTYRLTLAFARGAISDDHKNGVVNISCQMYGGVEDVGDGTGFPIIDAHEAEQHVIENFWLGQYRTGLWVTNTTAPKWPDGTYKVRSARFKSRQAFTASSLGGRGLTVAWYIRDAQPIPTWVQLWNDSTETKLGINGFGQFTLGYIDEDSDQSMWPRVTHIEDIFGPIQFQYNVNRENSGVFWCDWDPGSDKYRIGPITRKSSDAITKNKNRIKSGPIIQSSILQDQTQLEWVADRRIARLGDGQVIGDLPGQIGLLDHDVDIPGVLVTTIEGSGATGWVDRPVQVSRRNLDTSSRIVTYTVIDLENYVPPA